MTRTAAKTAASKPADDTPTEGDAPQVAPTGAQPTGLAQDRDDVPPDARTDEGAAQAQAVATAPIDTTALMRTQVPALPTGTGWEAGQAAPATKYLVYVGGYDDDHLVLRDEVGPGERGSVLVHQGEQVSPAAAARIAKG